MKRDWLKRALSYLLLVGVLVGALWFLQKSPLEVDSVVDLTGVRLHDSVPLSSLKVSFMDGDKWVCSTVHAFPESRYPSGPPGTTPPVSVKIVPGTYSVQLDLEYGEGDGAQYRESRTMQVEVAAAGRLEIKAEQAVPTNP